MLSDLLLNIIAEIFGIVITVFWIDRLFKRREREQEEKRWLPAKHIFYDRLAYELFSLLLSLKPQDERETDPKFVYIYGEQKVFSPINFSEVVNVPVKKYVAVLIERFDEYGHDMIQKRADFVESILDTYPQLIAPELLHLIMDFKFTCEELGRVYTDYSSEKNNTGSYMNIYGKETLKFELGELIKCTYNLLVWLDNHATQKMTFEEWHHLR